MPILAEVRWAANPFRGDRFAEGWLPVAEARTELAGYYQVPLVPTFHEVVGEGKALNLAPAGPS